MATRNLTVEQALEAADVRLSERIELAIEGTDADGASGMMWWPGTLRRAAEPAAFVRRLPVFEVELDAAPPLPAGMERVVFLDECTMWVLPDDATPTRWRLEGERTWEAPDGAPLPLTRAEKHCYDRYDLAAAMARDLELAHASASSAPAHCDAT